MSELNTRLQGTIRAQGYDSDTAVTTIANETTTMTLSPSNIHYSINNVSSRIGGGFPSNQPEYGQITVPGPGLSILAAIDGSGAVSPNDPNAILGQSGGIINFAKLGAGRYVITVSTGLFSGSPLAFVSSIGNAGVIGTFLFNSDTELSIAFDDVAANPTDAAFCVWIVGIIPIPNNSPLISFDTMPAEWKA